MSSSGAGTGDDRPGTFLPRNREAPDEPAPVPPPTGTVIVETKFDFEILDVDLTITDGQGSAYVTLPLHVFESTTFGELKVKFRD